VWPDLSKPFSCPRPAKIAAFKECGIEIAATPSDMAYALLRALKAKGVTLS